MLIRVVHQQHTQFNMCTQQVPVSMDTFSHEYSLPPLSPFANYNGHDFGLFADPLCAAAPQQNSHAQQFTECETLLPDISILDDLDIDDCLNLDAQFFTIASLDEFISNYIRTKHGIFMSSASSRQIAEKIIIEQGCIVEMNATTALEALINSGEIWTMIRLPTHTAAVQDTPPSGGVDTNATVAGGVKKNASIIPPKYREKKVMRGTVEDTYFAPGCYESMTDNTDIIKAVSGTDDEVLLQIVNFSNQGPTTKVKSDLALESKLFVDATWTLCNDYGVESKADVYRYLAMLPDRMCVYCKKPSSKVSCNSGYFKCQNCMNSSGSVSFVDGFSKWLSAGFPVRHAEIFNE